MIQICIGNAGRLFGNGSGKSDIDRKQMKPTISNHKVTAHRPQVYPIRSFQVLIVVGLDFVWVHVLIGSATPTMDPGVALIKSDNTVAFRTRRLTLNPLSILIRL